MRQLLLVVVLSFWTWPAGAERIIVGPSNNPYYNIYHPQTREEIYSSYRVLVDKRDGISKLEAKLIAQYEAAERDLDHGFDLAKPKVVAETLTHWTVRFPSKFSINAGMRQADTIVIIEKNKGGIEFTERPAQD